MSLETKKIRKSALQYNFKCEYRNFKCEYRRYSHLKRQCAEEEDVCPRRRRRNRAHTFCTLHIWTLDDQEQKDLLSRNKGNTHMYKYLCVCVCVYVCVCVCVCVCVYEYINVYEYMHMYIDMYICIYRKTEGYILKDKRVYFGH